MNHLRERGFIETYIYNISIYTIYIYIAPWTCCLQDTFEILAAAHGAAPKRKVVSKAMPAPRNKAVVASAPPASGSEPDT